LVVVLDVNVFVSAALSAAGPCAELVRAARDGVIDVVVSPLLLTELREVLQRDRFRSFLTLAEADAYLDELGRICRVEPDPPAGQSVLRDPDDDYLVALASAAEAAWIVSGDADLTSAALDPPAITPRLAVDRLVHGSD
jgi:putative PIN family toxin of toxin-antitoxin system